MLNQPSDPPADDELELSFFGPGYGESICLHLGSGIWMIVDSCLQPKTNIPAPLAYLDRIGVDVRQAVRLVVATHWHDDHVRGIGRVVEACESADVAMPQTLQKDEFIRLVELYSESAVMGHLRSGVDEFVSVFRLLRERRQRDVRFNAPLLASANKMLLRTPVPVGTHSVEARIASLSPADEDYIPAMLALRSLAPQHRQPKKRIASPSPNHASVVLWCEIGSHRLLLGADLECSPNPKTGWSAILTRSQVTNGQASLFKIPHHGSVTAHDDDVWRTLLSPEPVALLSPYRRGSQLLPTPADIDRITKLTPHVYMTALPHRERPSEWRDRVVRESIKQATKTMQPVDIGWGHIRVRQRIADPMGTWSVHLYGDAKHLHRDRTG